MLRVSPSEIAKFRRCRRSWALNYFYRWGPDPQYASATSVALLGTRIHAALEAYYGYNIDPVDALAAIYRHEVIKRPECEADLVSEHNWARIMVSGYLDWAAENGIDEEYDVVAVERTVEVPVILTNGEMAVVSGKLDQIVRRRFDNALCLRDWKPQPISEVVLTPEGWVRMGDIIPGDVVLGAAGEPVKVLNVYDRGVDDVFKITMNDGTSVRATADHPWLGRRWENSKENTVIQTSDLKRGSRIARYRPDMGPDTADADLAVSPYLLGAWIANGSSNGTVITDGCRSAMEETGLRLRTEERAGRKTQYLACLTPHLRKQLDDLELLNKHSGERFIPHPYLHEASWAQRLALLRGLMDGDGTFAEKHRPTAYYSTVSPRLAYDVADLVRSLGGWAKVWVNPKPTYTGSVEHRVTIRSDFNPFLRTEHAPGWAAKRSEIIQRKREGTRRVGTPNLEKIVWSVEPDGREEVRCIEVDSDDHLYVTSGYTVTHNTVGSLHKADLIVLDEQMRIYSALLTATTDGMRVDGALFAMLLRSKRTARAKGPFYEQVHISYNGHDHNHMMTRLRGVLDDMERVTRQLRSGSFDHRLVAYPNPMLDRCGWDCDYKNVCSLFDDGSRAEDAMRGNFIQRDPYGYRSSDLIDTVKAAFGNPSPVIGEAA